MKKIIVLFVFVLGVSSLVAQKGDMNPPKFRVLPTGDTIYVVVDEMPEFPGGEKAMYRYLGRSILYPVEAYEKRIEGRVIVQFLITPMGELKDIKVIKSATLSLDKEAVRVVSNMPKWIPGKQGGEIKTVEYNLPIMFRLR